MMAAYQPQPAGMHGGGVPHGHPAMTPGGQPMNPAQMQQMGHPGVSGPGQPHVTQAGAMMAMQPGAGMPGGMGGQPPGVQMGGMPGQMGGQSMAGGMPNVHAMNQAQIQQAQMMQHMANNPQLMQQRQQQMMQQRMMQQQMAQANGGNVPGMQQGMTPQQVQHMQQANPGMHPTPIQLPQHLQQQQMMIMRQQQAAAQQHQANQQMQQQLAMQHANSQNSNQGGQPGPPNQQGAQGQHPGQMRPQSRMANPNEQSQAPTPQSAQQGQQGQQQGQQNQQAAQQQNPQQQGQQQQITPQQLQAMRQQQQQQMLLRQQQQNAMRQQQMNQNQQMNGQAILFFLSMCDHLCQFDQNTGLDVDLWRGFVDKHFAPEAELTHSFEFPTSSKAFRVMRPAIGRYFYKYFESGAQSIRLHTDYVKEDRAPSNNRLRVTSSLATIRVVYSNGARLEMKGTLSADFTPSMVPEAIQHLEFYTATSEEVIGRNEIERLLSSWSPTMSSKTSPKMTTKKPPKAQQKMQSQLEGLTIDHFPKAHKGSWGGPSSVQSFLELGETFNLMSDVMTYAQERRLKPENAIEALATQYHKEGPPGIDPNQQGNPQLNLPPNGVPMGNRTPSMQGMGMPNAQGQFNSPSVSNLNLPMQNGMPVGMNGGSPHISHNQGLAPNMNMANSHTPSPHQAHMVAPQMMPQHSQQGTNSSAASANTSPNVNNKRRRSTVKMEGDDGGGEGGGGANRVKPSPRMGKKAKP